MCQDDTSGSPEGDVLPFLRGSRGSPPHRGPAIPAASNFAGALDELSEARAMVGLTALAAEALPAPHATEFGVMLDALHAKLGSALTTLSRGHGQPPLEPVGA